MSEHTEKGLLAAGYLCLAGAALAAHTAPATAYELSIYADTPMTVWVLLGGAYLVALVLAFSTTGRTSLLSLTLGTAATMLLIGLALVRDYRFLGSGDSLTHLGWAKGIAAGAFDPAELLYPAVHSLGVVLQEVTGSSLERNMLLVVLLFGLAYIVSTAILVRRMTDSRWALTFGVVSAWLFLPVINVAAYMMPFPTMQAILFAPFVFFALVFFLQRRGEEEGLLTPSGLLLVVLGSGLILVHPQQSVNVVFLLIAVVIAQTIYRRTEPDHAIASHQYALVPTALLTAILAAWLPAHPRTRAAVGGVVDSVTGGGSGAPSTIAQRGGSLVDLGSGLPVVFFRLFGVSFVFVLLSVLAVVSLWVYRDGDGGRETESFIAYFAGGAVPLVMLFGLYFVTTPTMAFRQFAFVMVVVTVLGAIQLSHLFESLEHRFSSRSVRAATVSVLALFVLLSAVTVFPSPYIFQSSGHVTDQQVEGHQSAFEHRVGDQDFSGIRTGPGRFAHAVFGIEQATGLKTSYHGSGIPEATFAAGNYTETYSDGQYLIVTRSDYERETALYDGFRYSEDGFERLGATPGVSKVMTNGELDLYTVGESSPA